MFAGCKHWSITFDPGLHGRQDTLGLAVCAPDTGLCAYGPTVVIREVPLEECTDELIIDLLDEGKELQRRPAHAEISALHKAMSTGFGFNLEDLKAPDDVFLRPLQSHEERVSLEDGAFGVKNITTGEAKPEIPAGWKPEFTASLFADQGSTGAAACNFLTFYCGYLMCRFNDVNHRVWNDVKSSFKKSRAYTWRVITYFTLVFNINYNPFGKGAWFESKKNRWEDWCKYTTIHNQRFRRYAPSIAEDYNKRHARTQGFVPLPRPESDADFQAILDTVKSMQNFQKCGPNTKIMRWWAWFAAYADVFGAELSALKMLLEDYLDDEVLELDDEEMGQGDARADLNDMKKKYGNFRTAYKCITDDTIWVARMLYHCVAPLWLIHSDRVAKVRTPEQFLENEVQMCKGKWAEELERLLDDTIRDATFCDVLDLFEPDAEDHLASAVDQVLWIYHYRVQSLKLHADEPPRSLLRLLSKSPAEVATFVTEVELQLSVLLATEDMEKKKQVPKTDNPLHLVRWRLNKLIRYLFLLVEKGDLQQVQCILTRLMTALDEKKIEDSSG